MAQIQVEKADLDRLREYAANSEWLFKNIEKLRQEHPNQYVAVCDHGELVMEGSSHSELVNKLTELGKDPKTCAIEFITKEAFILVV